MAEYKIEIRPKTDDGTYPDIAYPKTTADMVQDEINGGNVQDHLNNDAIHVNSSDKDRWNNKIDSIEKGSPNGVATLNGSGQVPSSQLSDVRGDILITANRKGVIDYNDFIALRASNNIDRSGVFIDSSYVYQLNTNSDKPVWTSRSSGEFSGNTDFFNIAGVSGRGSYIYCVGWSGTGTSQRVGIGRVTKTQFRTGSFVSFRDASSYVDDLPAVSNLRIYGVAASSTSTVYILIQQSLNSPMSLVRATLDSSGGSYSIISEALQTPNHNITIYARGTTGRIAHISGSSLYVLGNYTSLGGRDEHMPVILRYSTSGAFQELIRIDPRTRVHWDDGRVNGLTVYDGKLYLLIGAYAFRVFV